MSPSHSLIALGLPAYFVLMAILKENQFGLYKLFSMSIFQPKIHSLTKELINVQLMKRLGRIKYVLKVLNFR